MLSKKFLGYSQQKLLNRNRGYMPSMDNQQQAFLKKNTCVGPIAITGVHFLTPPPLAQVYLYGHIASNSMVMLIGGLKARAIQYITRSFQSNIVTLGIH
jgi:hypothetical protein